MWLQRYEQYFYWGGFLAVAILYAVKVTHKINLVTADLGRHIKNGQIILSNIGNGQIIHDILHTNFYSYTNGSASFVNHHWLSGAFYYLVWKIGDFAATSYAYAILSALAILVFMLVAKTKANFWLILATALWVIPLAAGRAEVRPEVFTYLFCGISFFILLKNYWGELSNKWLLIPPIMQLLWVNLHIGFIFGIFLICVFGLVELVRFLQYKKHNFLKYLYLGISVTVASLFNPSFIKGVLYPFLIFREYGYKIVENQSITFLEDWGMKANMHFALYRAVVIVLILTFVLAAWRKRYKEGDFWVMLIIALTFSTLAFLGIRNFPMLAMFAIPIIAINLSLIDFRFAWRKYLSGAGVILTVIALVFVLKSIKTDLSIGIGLLPNELNSARFFKNNNLKGPIFNNYDIGGYLIFNLYPQEKVFTDNRPEAYSKDFFDNTYITAQENPSKFTALDNLYHFNAIYFSRLDLTTWGQAFLISSLNSKDWAPVYVDSYTIIFLKRNAQNEAVIKKFELPRSMFTVS